MVVERIQISGTNGDGSLLTFTKLYARKDIPVGKEEIATPANIKKWKQLKSIPNKII